MTSFSSIPSYLLGTIFTASGIISFVSPRQNTKHSASHFLHLHQYPSIISLIPNYLPQQELHHPLPPSHLTSTPKASAISPTASPISSSNSMVKSQRLLLSRVSSVLRDLWMAC
ncbi:hypothetical protein DL95DRAFT_389536 [Leptodontidium sp. 2 PMI_412]|nr:hypothetical protein DL95DRAFT_389536 [Leptodontidium sp. 2 PMI_412]